MTARLRWLGMLSILVLTLPLAVALEQPTRANADSDAQLRQGSLADLVVDSSHSHVFVSGGPGASGIEVYTFAGAPVTMIEHEPGASDMVLSPDGTRLFVALFNGDAVSAIDTATLAEVGRWHIGVASAPTGLAWAGDRLWVSYAKESGDRAIAPLNPGDPSASLGVPLLATFGPTTPPMAGGGDVLLVVNPQASVTEPAMTSYDASASPPTVLGQSAPGDSCLNPSVTPDGQAATYTCLDGNQAQLRVVGAADFTLRAQYPIAGYPVAAAGGGDALASGSWGSGPEISVFGPGGTAPLRTYSLAPEDVQPQGLAFSADGSRLFAISQVLPDGPMILHVLANPTLPPLPTSVSITSNKSTYDYGATAIVTAHLGPTNNSRVLRIYALPYHSTSAPRLLKSAAVDASGNLSASYRVTYRTTFTASFASDDRYAPAAATRAVAVRARMTVTMKHAYGKAGRYLLYRPTRQPVMIIDALPVNQTIRTRVQLRRNGKWHNVPAMVCLATKRAGSTRCDLEGSPVVGPKFRTRAWTQGSTFTARTKTPWQRFRYRG
jgi:hypothetical protein